MNKKFAIVLALSLIAIVCCAGCIDPQDQVDPVDPVVPVDPVDPVTPPVDPVVPAVEYSVFFMLNYDGAGAYTAETVTAGDAVSKPATPTRSGYTFKGWFTAAEGGAEYDFTQAVNADLTLYAQWSKKSSSGSSHSHSYSWNVVKAANCTVDGQGQYVCSCGQVKSTESIPATGHTSTKLSGTDVICTICNTNLGSVIAQVGENYYSEFDSAIDIAAEKSLVVKLLTAVTDGAVTKNVVIDTNKTATYLNYNAGLTIKINQSNATNLGTVMLDGAKVFFKVDDGDNYVADTEGYLIVEYTKKESTYTVMNADGLKRAIKDAESGATIKLIPNVNYGKVLLTDIKILPTNIKIIGEKTASIGIEDGSGEYPNYNRNYVYDWTFENVVFTVDGLKFYNNYVAGDGVDVKNLTLINCVFKEGTNLVISGDKHENIVIQGCSFENTDSTATAKVGKSAIMIYGSNGVTIERCTFTKPGYNAIQLAKDMTGTIKIQNNVITDTASRAMRIETIDGAVLTISDNTMTNANNAADTDTSEQGEVVKITGVVLIGTFSNNTHNGNEITFTDGIAK